MFRPNANFGMMPQSYLFSEVARRVSAFKASHPEEMVIRMDIGDVSLPLPEVVTRAMKEATDEMGCQSGFHGYGPEQGYEFLRQQVAEYDYRQRGISTITPDDIFISDGAKSDIGNLGDLFGPDLRIAVCDPGYPVYVDSNVMAGHGGVLYGNRWSGLTYLECLPENGFNPSLPEEEVDVIYLCSPCNPTGAAMTKEQLKEWVEYALDHKALIIFDSAYEAYVTEEGIARSIYEVEGAERCAIEVRSFSKTAGFTGVRCGYTVVPASLEYTTTEGEILSLRKMWNRRQCTKFNGVGYIVQRGAAALYTPDGREAIRQNVGYYMDNAHKIREALRQKGFEVTGGVNSPYLWFKGKSGEGSWEMFDRVLNKLQLSSTPGVGFGDAGEGYLRFTGFNSAENTDKAIERILKSDL